MFILHMSNNYIFFFDLLELRDLLGGGVLSTLSLESSFLLPQLSGTGSRAAEPYTFSDTMLSQTASLFRVVTC